MAVGASPGSSPALSGSGIALSGFVVMAMEMLGKGVFSKLFMCVVLSLMTRIQCLIYRHAWLRRLFSEPILPG